MNGQIKKIKYPENLPIVAERQAIIAAIKKHQVVIIAGDTGSGKTTQLPKMCLDAGRGVEQKIGCTQPRRIAATSIAARVAEELGESGSVVGYKIRFRNQTSAATRIKFMTDGILLAEAQGDKRLSAYDTIIIDEAHERSLNIDFLLGIMQRILKRRPDLKLIITSATIDTEKFAKAFGNAPIIEVTGRTFPVEIRYPEREENGDGGDYVEQAVQAALELMRRDGPGDMLLFMPTERDIREAVALFESRFGKQKGRQTPLVLPLYGRLAGRDQNRVFQETNRGKIVVATNVAETSLTVPGIRYVVDTGLARILSYNVRARTSKLPIAKISRASCDQRAGRCGRVGPGICLRLFEEKDYLNRSEFTRPEILRSNLAEVILRMTSLNLGEPASFPFVDPPTGRAIADGYHLLTELGALDKKRRLTRSGRLMARLPLDPRISRMIIEARHQNCVREMVIVAAALSIQDPRIRPSDREAVADETHARFQSETSDFESLLNLWNLFTSTAVAVGSLSRLRKFCKQNFLSFQRMREWQDIHEQIRSILAEEGRGKRHGALRFVENSEEASYDQIHRAILSGNLRNIGLKKAKNIYQGCQDKELMVFPGSGQFGKNRSWIMAGELMETSRLFARIVAGIKPEWIEPLAGHLCKRAYLEPHWAKKQGMVVAKEQVSLFGLIIVAGRRLNYGKVAPVEAREIFIQHALVAGELGGSFRFLAENRRLIKNMEEVEHRTRQRGVLVDELEFFDFYAKRLPQDVFDRQGLARCVKKGGGDDFLRMREADIVKGQPDDNRLADFPESIHCGELTFKLRYCFEPGQNEDGIAVVIPKNLAAHSRREHFEWLVPGLLQEKVTCLLKSLPKSIRRNLVPIPHSAERLMPLLAPYQGNLFRQLEEAILKVFQLRVEPGMWSTDNLPRHLCMRFELVDGEEVESTRDPKVLVQKKIGQDDDCQGLVALRKRYERDGVRSWDFDDLPDRFQVKDNKGNLTGFAYPGLLSQGKAGVGLRVFSDIIKCRSKTREALLVLYGLQFVKGLKSFEKDFSLPRAHWALYEGVASHEEINKDLFSFILREIFCCQNGLIPGKDVFTSTLENVKKAGPYVLGKKVLDQVVIVLQERRATLDFISGLENQCRGKKYFGISEQECAMFRAEVARYLPPDFLATMNAEKLLQVPRYLKGLTIRLQRKLQDPAKDAARLKEITPFVDWLADVRKREGLPPEVEEEFDHFATMIEELRISLFAQELKTLFPISSKRLKKKQQAITILLP
ncbi:MAG: ATP-dependent RNA helicase HrpA [Thermodesulfobacteriota bacterium]